MRLYNRNQFLANQRCTFCINYFQLEAPDLLTSRRSGPMAQPDEVCLRSAQTETDRNPKLHWCTRCISVFYLNSGESQKRGGNLSGFFFFDSNFLQDGNTLKTCTSFILWAREMPRERANNVWMKKKTPEDKQRNCISLLELYNSSAVTNKPVLMKGLLMVMGK